MSDWGLFTHYIQIDELEFYDIGISDKDKNSHNDFYINKLLFNKVVKAVLEKGKYQPLDRYLDELASKHSAKNKLKTVDCPCNFAVYSNHTRIEKGKLMISKQVIYERAIE